MPALILGLMWFAVVMWLLARVIRQFRVHECGSLRALECGEPLPSVAVVVPTRDEAGNIETCLTHLLAQSGVEGRISVFVLDDESQDGTPEIAGKYAGGSMPVEVLAAGPLPSGWLGKPHACWRGALASRSDWLCFIDADVRASPDLLRVALLTAKTQHLHMLSLHPHQELGGFWERVVLPAGMLMIACAKDHSAAQDPISPEATANGQFILIRRDIYFAVGGHAAVRMQICEDQALARLVKQSGHRLRAVGGEKFIRTRMYTGLQSLWEGFSKNAIEIMGTAHGTLATAVGGLLVGWSTWLIPILAVTLASEAASVKGWLGFVVAGIGSLVIVAVQVGTLRHFQTSALYVFLFPVGVSIAAAIAVHSIVLRLRGRTTWKGRSYEVGRKVR